MRLDLALLFSSVILLTGCSLTPTAAPVPERGAALQGVVHGGQQPVVGAHVFLFQANTFSYGENSLSLMINKPGNTILDTSGGATNGYYYVTTASDGTFTITGDYNCTANSQVYLYAVGGNPGSGANSAAGFLAALGTCPFAGSFSSSTFVTMNEVTTIATAYALAGFATDAVHISSSGTALAQQGVANAFANINNLVSSTGTALATTPSGAGTVPQTTINTLANILAACVNSASSVSSSCTTLFSNARDSHSNVPTDTATTAINIAHNPAANVSSIFGIPTPTPPFAPALPSSPVPNDFTIGLSFSGGGLNIPTSIAIDGSGNAWISNEGKPELTEISSSGSLLSGANGFAGGDPFNYFYAITIDTFGNAWTVDPPDNAIIEFSSSGVVSGNSPIVATGVSGPYSLAFDSSGDLWVADVTTSKLSVLSNSGVPIAGPYTGGGLNSPIAVAIDGSGNIWAVNFNASTGIGTSVSKCSSAGVSKAGTTGYTANFHDPQGIAIDASGNAWIADQQTGVVEISPTGAYISTGYKTTGTFQPNSIAIDGLGNAWVTEGAPAVAGGGNVAEISSTGTFLSGNKGYAGAGAASASGIFGIAVDGSGNVWVLNRNNNAVAELIGVAAPVVTPIVTGVKNNTLGTRP